MKSFSTLIEVLYPPLIRPHLALISLLMVTSVIKSSGIFENVFPQRLAAPKLKVFKSEKASGFVIDKYVNSIWC